MTISESSMLDQALSLSLCGDLQGSRKITEQILHDDPKCIPALFNMGWHYMSDGDLQNCHRHLDYGREINVFGNRHIGSIQPIWHGEQGTILLSLEGGLGDQIHAVRYAFYLARQGKVIVSCSSSLAAILIEVEGVGAVVQHEAALGAYHDYWLPSMSAPVALQQEYKDICGESYITKTAECENKIGIRFSGNPEFEHEQHRVFPRELMLEVVAGLDCINLQQGEQIPGMDNP